MDAWSDRVLWFKFIKSETKAEYQEGLDSLKGNNYEILSVTIDGKIGIKEVFLSYQVQICQFHFQANILRKTTLNPKSILGQKLKYIATHFINKRWTADQFQQVYDRLTT
jgi:transposase-like protein